MRDVAVLAVKSHTLASSLHRVGNLGRLLGGSSQDGRKWLGSPPFICHEVRPFGRGTTLLRGLIDHGFQARTNWDDAPSTFKEIGSSVFVQRLLCQKAGGGNFQHTCATVCLGQIFKWELPKSNIYSPEN